MGDSAAPATLISYYRCLRDNPHYRNLWIADFIDNIGAWLNYVATLELVEHFSHGSGLAVTAVIMLRFIPSLVLSPVAGVLADRCNRIVVLVVAALADSILVAALAFIRNPSQAPLLYVLLAAQFTAIALQDPARRAIVPVLVPASQLHLATTLETFSWSLTGAVGAAAGGAIASRLGNSACFIIDAATYLVAAWFASKVPRSLGDPEAYDKSVNALKKLRSGLDPEAAAAASIELASIVGGGIGGGIVGGGGSVLHDDDNKNGTAGHTTDIRTQIRKKDHDNNHHHHLPAATSPTLTERRHTPFSSTAAAGGGALEDGGSGVLVDLDIYTDSGSGGGVVREDAPLLIHPRGSSGGTDSTAHTNSTMIGTAAPSMTAAALASFADGVAAAKEGWRYLTLKQNRDVAALVLMKGCGSITWGAVDVLNVRFSELPYMQVSDGPTTLGLIFATVGTGCFLGPVALNALVPPQPRPLLWACAASFFFLFLGSALMTAAQSLTLVLAATFVRAVGSATLWIYSTLLLQLRCPNSILGRVSATEMALYTVAEATSSVFGGAAFDLMGLTLRQTTATLTVVAGGVSLGWAYYAWIEDRHWRSRSSASTPSIDEL